MKLKLFMKASLIIIKPLNKWNVRFSFVYDVGSKGDDRLQQFEGTKEKAGLIQGLTFFILKHIWGCKPFARPLSF
jgi:hypothetical protein